MLNNNYEEMKLLFLYFKRKYIGYRFLHYINEEIDDTDNNLLINNLKKIFTYIKNDDINKFVKYSYALKIKDYNKIRIKFNLCDFDNYINELDDKKILVDIQRLCYSPKFIEKIGIYKLINKDIINTNNLSYIKEERLYYYNFNNISNNTEFAKNILNKNKYIKYLLHQDIHNSIINPLLIMILSVNYYKYTQKNAIVQLDKIKQIYRNISNKMIELYYYVTDLFIYNYEINKSMPELISITPFLLIKCIIKISSDNYKIYLSY